MTIRRINGRRDWWRAEHKVNGKQYVEFGWTLDVALEYLFAQMEKDGHYLLAKPYQLQ